MSRSQFAHFSYTQARIYSTIIKVGARSCSPELMILQKKPTAPNKFTISHPFSFSSFVAVFSAGLAWHVVMSQLLASSLVWLQRQRDIEGSHDHYENTAHTVTFTITSHIFTSAQLQHTLHIPPQLPHSHINTLLTHLQNLQWMMVWVYWHPAEL